MFYVWMILIGLHVLFALMWMGGNFVLTFLVVPAVMGSSPAAQAEVSARLGSQASRFFRPVATIAIVLGIIVGAHTGAFHSLNDVFLTAFGRTYLIALVLAVGIWLYGEFVIGRLARAIGDTLPELRPLAIQRVVRATILEKVGFIAILACMILMRFGL
jgi:uncharacterized membrane protein